MAAAARTSVGGLVADSPQVEEGPGLRPGWVAEEGSEDGVGSAAEPLGRLGLHGDCKGTMGVALDFGCS